MTELSPAAAIGESPGPGLTCRPGGRATDKGESRPTAAVPTMENPCCSCKLTRTL